MSVHSPQSTVGGRHAACRSPRPTNSAITYDPFRRKFAFLAVFCALWCCTGAMYSARGDEVASEPAGPYQALLDAYWSEIAVRPMWNRATLEDHTANIRAVMECKDGEPILDSEAGIFSWNALLGNVELWLEDEQQTLSLFVHDVGRVAFEGTNLSGFVDTLGEGHLFFLLEVDGATSLWTSETEGVTTSEVALVNPVKCLCKGSNNVCANGRIACRTEAPCTYTNYGGTHSSYCKYLIAPLQ